MAKVCISGHYGFDSADHELMLMAMINSLQRQAENMEITVFSADPAKTEADFEVAAVSRNSWDQIHKELASADMLIVGGGLLLKETSDLADIKYYIKMIKTAMRRKMPVFVFHQIFEPFTSSRAKKMVAGVMQKVRKISVADENSVEVLHEMGIRRSRIHVTESPLLNLADVEAEWKVSEFLAEDKKAAARSEQEKKEEKAAPINYDGMDVEIEIRIVEKKEEAAVDPDKTIVIADLAEVAAAEEDEAVPAEAPAEPENKMAKPVSSRPHNLGTVVPSFWKKPGEKFAAFVVSPKTELPKTQIAAMADHLVESGYQVVFVPVSYPKDVDLGKELLGMMKHSAYEVDAKISPQSVYTAINEVDFVFTNELYPMMIAAVCKKPFASLCCTGKDFAFVSALGLTPTGSMLDFNEESFVYNFKAAVADTAAVIAAIEENLPALKEQAEYGEDQIRMIYEQIRRRKERAARPHNAHDRHDAHKEEIAAPEEAVAEAPAELVEEEPVEAPTEELNDIPADAPVKKKDAFAGKKEHAPKKRPSNRKADKASDKKDVVSDMIAKIKEKIASLIEMLKGKVGKKSAPQKRKARKEEEDALVEKELLAENDSFEEFEEVVDAEEKDYR